MAKLKLTLTNDEWFELNQAAAKQRTLVTVLRLPLEKLLNDHSALIALHKGEVVE